MVLPFLTLAAVITSVFSYVPCTGSFCPPTWLDQRTDYTESGHVTPIFLGTDEESGCACKDYPQEYRVCFGRESCRIFPKNFNFTLTLHLRIKGTQIFDLKPGDLNNVTHLESLKIEGNHNLSRVWPRTFINMTKLTNLTMSYNENLKYLDNGCFDGLASLQELFLVKNAFLSVTDVTPALSKKSLPNLVKLYLSENNFVNISQSDFQPMTDSRLEELNLVLCQIEDIHPESFTPLTNLKVLRLGENFFNISTLTKVIETTVVKVPLRALNLYSIGLRKGPSKPLMETIGKSNITSLCLARNQFEIISSEIFHKMPNLEILDLREVLALNITNDAFVGLPNLKTLLLNGNKLSSIPEGVLLEQLTYLDLQQNSGNTFSVSSFSIFGQKFINMKKLELLNLSFNKIFKIFNSSFTGLSNLRILGLKNATIFQIANGSFAMLPKLSFLNLENNFFAEERGLHPEIFLGLSKLKVLLLGGCDIKFIRNDPSPFQELKSLNHLGLGRNKLLTIQNLAAMPSLISIDLSENSLQPWTSRIFTHNLGIRDVRANYNKFTYITSAMMEDFQNLTKLELRENPFTCDCKVSWKNEKVFTLIENQSILCAFPDTVTNLTVVDFYETKYSMCRNKNLVKLVLLVVLGLLLVLITTGIFLMYYYRWHLRYWVFLTRLYLGRKSKAARRAEKTGYINYIYDGFVSYSNEDRNFVIRLVTMLENYPPFLKLCVYERDFEVGTIITENVLESVAKSRKTLLIVSDSYAKSQWCRWESQLAQHHKLFFQNENGDYVDDSLILIKLGPVSDTHLTPTLKYLLKTRIYLQWDIDEKKQKVFWEKLRTTLKPPREVIENTHL